MYPSNLIVFLSFLYVTRGETDLWPKIIEFSDDYLEKLETQETIYNTLDVYDKDYIESLYEAVKNEIKVLEDYLESSEIYQDSIQKAKCVLTRLTAFYNVMSRWTSCDNDARKALNDLRSRLDDLNFAYSNFTEIAVAEFTDCTNKKETDQCQIEVYNSQLVPMAETLVKINKKHFTESKLVADRLNALAQCLDSLADTTNSLVQMTWGTISNNCLN